MSFIFLICMITNVVVFSLNLLATLLQIEAGCHLPSFQWVCNAGLYSGQCPLSHSYCGHCNFCDGIWHQFFCLSLCKSSTALLLVSLSTICIRKPSQAQSQGSWMASTRLCSHPCRWTDGWNLSRWERSVSRRLLLVTYRKHQLFIFSVRQSVTDTKTLSLSFLPPLSSTGQSPISWWRSVQSGSSLWYMMSPLLSEQLLHIHNCIPATYASPSLCDSSQVSVLWLHKGRNQTHKFTLCAWVCSHWRTASECSPFWTGTWKSSL